VLDRQHGTHFHELWNSLWSKKSTHQNLAGSAGQAARHALSLIVELIAAKKITPQKFARRQGFDRKTEAQRTCRKLLHKAMYTKLAGINI